MARILIVDPDKASRGELRDLFDGPDREIHCTGDGIHALRMVLDHDIDVVIAELQLPGMTGFELLSEVRKQRPDTAVVLLTPRREGDLHHRLCTETPPQPGRACRAAPHFESTR